ncbi:MAG TPA: hypothetical protein VKQ06_01810 [Gammaproteobacteria bacterium]|nr:hypothetical protein [Gammaproteobacteria bacterium]
MKPGNATLAAILPALAIVSQTGAQVVDTRSLEERIVLDDAADIAIVVDNIFGSVRVTGHDEPVVELSAIETVTGDTQTDIERARAEVSLRTMREPGRVAFLVRRGEGCDCACGCRWDGYKVAYDIELRIPRDAAFDVSTVNDGDIEVENVRGEFSVSNVNGDVTLRGLRAAGHAKTVNGELTAAFERSPSAATSFETINGEIDVAFPADISADLFFRTMRGEIWTDFDVTALPVTPGAETRQSRRTVIRSDRHAAVRVDSGGPAFTFETLNGDITIRELR